MKQLQMRYDMIHPYCDAVRFNKNGFNIMQFNTMQKNDPIQFTMVQKVCFYLLSIQQIIH